MIQVTYFKKTGGKRIFKMAPIHHHFELCGWSETRVVAVFWADATKPPSASEPVSPIKILAGYTLNNKNPSSAPTTAHVIGSIPLFVPTATTVKNVATSKDYSGTLRNAWIWPGWIPG